MNASDTRGRKALDTIIKESLSNTSVTGMLQGNEVLPFVFNIGAALGQVSIEFEQLHS